jgi:hypothetical protein
MKIRSLLLGSVAAAGLSTGAYAADLGVLTAVNVCDELGLSGLIVASDTHCLQISGEVKYEFRWGDYESQGPGTDDDPAPRTVIDTEAGVYDIADGDEALDWRSRVDAFVKFVATANSDFGPVKAVIKIKEVQYVNGFGSDFDGNVNETVLFGGSDTADGDGYYFDEAYVSAGDSTILMAGKKSTIMNLTDDVPLNHLGLFNSEDVDVGVKWGESIPDGGHVIQVTSDLGNGVSVGVGLENINDISPSPVPVGNNTSAFMTGAGTAVYKAGTLVGVLAYAGDGITAHITGVAGGVLDGVIENFAVHAGMSATFDPITFRAAIAANNNLPDGCEGGGFDPGCVDGVYWNALATAAVAIDMFTVAVSGEAVTDRDGGDALTGDVDVGAGGSISAAVMDTVTINLGSRWYHDALTDEDAVQAEAQLVAAVTETLKLTGAVGVVASDDLDADLGSPVFYGAAELAWAPGGGFTASAKGEAFSNGAWRTIFKAGMPFQ